MASRLGLANVLRQNDEILGGSLGEGAYNIPEIEGLEQLEKSEVEGFQCWERTFKLDEVEVSWKVFSPEGSEHRKRATEWWSSRRLL